MCVHTSRNAVAKQALVKGRQTCTARFWDFFTFQQWCPVNEMIYCWGCPVFDRLQYVKPEGESQVYFITWMTSVLTLVDRGGEGSMIERTSLRPYLVVSAPSAGVSNVHKVKNVSLQVRNEERVLEIRRHSHDKIHQTFPLRYFILQVVKTGR